MTTKVQQGEETPRLERELDFRKIIDTIPALAWSSRVDGSVDFLNQHYVDYTGRTIDELLDWRWTEVVFPEDIDGLVQAWQAVMETGQPGEAEARLRRYDGEYRWFLFRSSAVHDDQGNIIKFYGFNVDIEDRKRSEQTVAESERNLKHIIDALPTTAWATRPDGYCEFLSHRWLDYAGMTLEQCIGWGWSECIHPDDVPGLVAYWQAALETGTPVDTEARMRRYDGAYRWFLFRANPVRDAMGNIVRWYGTNVDIEDRKRADDELRRSEAFLADAQRLSRTGSFAWKVDSNEVEWSDETYRIYDFDPAIPVTIDAIRSRTHPDSFAMMNDVMQRARQEGGDFDYETKLIMPDQSVKYLHVVAHSEQTQGGMELRGAVQDVTERHLADEILSKVRSELAHVTRVTSLGALTASIAHEVNQPLAGIITNASTCLRMLSSEPPNLEIAQETARRMIRDGNRAADVITRLRALFRNKTTTLELMNLNEAVKEVVALASGDLQRINVDVRTELASRLATIKGDRVQIQQVIMNLLRNAADAMRSVEDRPRRVFIRTQLDGDQVQVSVSDVGVGFGNESIDKFFEPFYTTKNDGMGIGLHVCRSIVDRHQGKLWAKPNNDGPGVTFFVSLPNHLTDTEVEDVSMAAQVVAASRSEAGLHGQ